MRIIGAVQLWHWSMCFMHLMCWIRKCHDIQGFPIECSTNNRPNGEGDRLHPCRLHSVVCLEQKERDMGLPRGIGRIHECNLLLYGAHLRRYGLSMNTRDCKICSKWLKYDYTFQIYVLWSWRYIEITFSRSLSVRPCYPSIFIPYGLPYFWLSRYEVLRLPVWCEQEQWKKTE